ncbi:ParA family protein (plasmid) [Methylomonas sp. MED-D]|uniref:ParA family protein n=1 Tax=Methylomonas sp. MED-D TaxID=3418768 RepID=UPI003CFD02ED
MRHFTVRPKHAMEFAGFVGKAKDFKALFPEKNASEPYQHTTYSALDIRKAKLKLSGYDPEALNINSGLPPIINCRMSKGGVGKTTICGGIASALAMQGYKTLMLDGDPQASLTGLFGINWASENIIHIGDLLKKYGLKEKYDIESSVFPLYEGNMLDLIASDISLSNIDSWLMGVTNREFTFKKFFEANVEFFSKYDVLVIDSAPSTNLLTNAFMCASKKLLAVVWLDGQSLKAMQVLASNVNELNEAFHSNDFYLDVHIVANGYHPSYSTCKDALSTLVSSYGDKLNDNIIPHASSFMRQIELFKESESGTVLEREPNSTAARSIIDLSKSLIKEYNLKMNGHLII